MTALLQLCDLVRDDTLPELGVRLEDHEGEETQTQTQNQTQTQAQSPPGAQDQTRASHVAVFQVCPLWSNWWTERR